MNWKASRRPGLLLAGILVVGLVVVLPLTNAGAGTFTPRNDPSVPLNKSRGESGAGSDCYTCHILDPSWKAPDLVIVYPEAPLQLKIGQAYDLPVQIINPWKHQVRDISLEVILHGERQVLSVLADTAARSVLNDQVGQAEATLGLSKDNPLAASSQAAGRPPYTVEMPIVLEPNGTRFFASVELSPHGAPPGVAPDEYSVDFFTGAAGPRSSALHFQPNSNGALHRTFSKNMTVGGPMRVVVEHLRGQATTTTIYLNYTLIKKPLDVSGKAYRIHVPANATIEKGAAPLPVIVRILPFDKGTQEIEFRTRIHAHYKHSSNEQDDENFTRTALLDQPDDLFKKNLIYPRRALVVGDEFVPSPYATTSVVIPEAGWQIVAAEMTGYAAAGLLVPSLILGGTYGRGSRQFLNLVVGGAKRRVMYHSLLSMGLSLVALVHILLFVWETAYGLTVGVLWGGFGAVSLLVLGLTGYYQVPLIQRRGFGTWRTLHLTTGLAVILFVALHSVLDGSDFGEIKEQLPTWLRSLNIDV